MTTLTAPARLDRPILLSLLWVFLLLNFIYCDVLGLHDGAVLTSLLAGQVGTLQITPIFLLLSSVLMEIPIALVLVSRLAPRKPNRIANIAAGSFMAVVQVSSLFAGTPASFSYLFFSVIEVATLVVIVVTAARWGKQTTA